MPRILFRVTFNQNWNLGDFPFIINSSLPEYLFHAHTAQYLIIEGKVVNSRKVQGESLNIKSDDFLNRFILYVLHNNICLSSQYKDQWYCCLCNKVCATEHLPKFEYITNITNICSSKYLMADIFLAGLSSKLTWQPNNVYCWDGRPLSCFFIFKPKCYEKTLDWTFLLKRYNFIFSWLALLQNQLVAQGPSSLWRPKPLHWVVSKGNALACHAQHRGLQFLHSGFDILLQILLGHPCPRCQVLYHMSRHLCLTSLAAYYVLHKDHLFQVLGQFNFTVFFGGWHHTVSFIVVMVMSTLPRSKGHPVEWAVLRQIIP